MAIDRTADLASIRRFVQVIEKVLAKKARATGYNRSRHLDEVSDSPRQTCRS